MNLFAFNTTPIDGWETLSGSGTVTIALSPAGTADIGLGAGGSAHIALSSAGAGTIATIASGAAGIALRATGIGKLALLVSGLLRIVLGMKWGIPAVQPVPTTYFKAPESRRISQDGDVRVVRVPADNVFSVPNEPRREIINPDKRAA